MNPRAARALFDANARSYDRVNSIIAMGLDARWRDWMARRAVSAPGARVLDAFAGTGEVGLRAAALGADVTLADVSPAMLGIARSRAERRRLDVTVVETDLTAPHPVVGGPFDVVTLMFGLRYVAEPSEVLRRLAGLLSPAGRMVIADFVEPAPGFLSKLAGGYFFRVIPSLAGTLAGRRELYDALVSSTRRMGSSSAFGSLVEAAGLSIIEARTMGFGMVRGVVAVRELP